MSLAIAHFAVGLLCTALLLAAVAPRLVRSPTLLAFGGLWGMLPDAYWVSPVGLEFIHSVHVSPWANLFWFHGYLDRIDPADTNTFAAEMLALLVVSLPLIELFVRWRLGEFGSRSGLMEVPESKRRSD
ncbi:hypothetical protein [Candidatus Halobonum tyrrellensis]|uniref:Uncharacterized protein n=1 Tax=Candidatus Halobonum tyrrellensis G22 TaxID=1324957 RepID=V4HI39_9EURY|nr:hypothetical protein [Candidatus Halobonum tyrrellensis]ESP87584.1 hypothetical protein K933_13409 [Candidatus Halobonum tyrrellensis G22]